MPPRFYHQYRILFSVAYTLLIGACSRYELPTIPEPLASHSWQGSAPTDEKSMIDSPALSGTFNLTGEITQVALNGPPLRLRVELTLRADPNGELIINSKRVTPQGLESLLKIPEGKVTNPAKVWPLAALVRLHRPQLLEEWMNRPTQHSNCQAASRQPARFSFTTGSLNHGLLHQYRTETLSDESRRNEITGFAHTKKDGRINEVDVKIRRWAQLKGDACDLVQEERISITGITKP